MEEIRPGLPNLPRRIQITHILEFDTEDEGDLLSRNPG
jgi:hypothetical protein